MRVLMTVFALLGMLSLTACNTVRGMGQDIEKAGETIQKAGSK
jgi:predicted small secreted protein